MKLKVKISGNKSKVIKDDKIVINITENEDKYYWLISKCKHDNSFRTNLI